MNATEDKSLEYVCRDLVMVLPCPHCLREVQHQRCFEKPEKGEITWKCSECKRKHVTNYQLNFLYLKKHDRDYQ